MPPSVDAPPGTFDLCARCANDAVVRRTVACKKAGIPSDSPLPPGLLSVPHTSFDFALKPMPCISCARILSAEDD
jgi:hypothetical protein